jgi:hypothetical protein
VAFDVVVGLRFGGGGGGGSGAGFNTGEDRNAVGDGIVIVSILTISYIGPSTMLEMARANTICTRSNRCVVCVSRTLSRGGNFPLGEGVRSVSCLLSLVAASRWLPEGKCGEHLPENPEV